MQLERKYVLPVAAFVGLLAVVAFSYLNLPKTFVYGQNSASVADAPTPASAKAFAAIPESNDDDIIVADAESISAEPTASPNPSDGSKRPRIAGEKSFSPLTLRAAAENARLQYNLAWAFGGKAQRGWFLYAALLRETLDMGDSATADAAAPEFADAIGDFQQKIGMTPDGILDADTLYKIIELWQARRLKMSDYPSPDKLLTAPVADFYDPGRAPELMKVERETYAAYKRMVAAAAKDKSLNLRTTQTGELAPEEKFLKIVSSFRSREYQEKLRRESPGSGRAGLATNSPHFTGRALDIYVGGEPTITKDANRAVQIQTPVYKWLVKNAERFGFRPYFYEPWHWEYIPEHLRKQAAE